MPIAKEIKIIKVPLSDTERLPDYPKNFPKMPRMYLELFENKGKIKQDLINKEYVPKEDKQSEDRQERPKEDRQDLQDRQERPKEDRKDHQDHQDRQERPKEDREERPDRSDEKEKEESDKSKERKSSRDKIKEAEDSEINEKFADKESNDSHSKSSSDSGSDSDSDSRSGSDSDSRSGSDSDSRGSSPSSPSNSESDISKTLSSEDNEVKNNKSGGDDLSDRLKELLGESDNEDNVKQSPKTTDKYSRPPKEVVRSRTNHFTPYEKYKEIRKIPENAPTLAELEAKGHYQPKQELRDINHITTTEYDNEDMKREYMFKFDLLKKSYPMAVTTIPEYTIHSDMREMQKSYECTVRRLSLDSTVDSYKQYLLGGFMLVEFVFGNFLGFDMQGFTQQQIIGMHNYEKLLIELGEKSYVPSGSKWPVELRLLFVIIMNAGFFIVGKLVMRKTGANLMGMLNSINTPATPPDSSKPKRRMKGPNINIDNIPDIDDSQLNPTNPANPTNPTNPTMGGGSLNPGAPVQSNGPK